MELVYLWIGKDKVIENQGFNFSPRFKCEYKNNHLDVKYLENIETDFFSKNIDITAIVGKNGSGKSSLVQHLLFEHSAQDNGFNYNHGKEAECKIWVSDGISDSVQEVTFKEYMSTKNIILYHEDIDSTLYRNQYNSNQIIANIIGTEDRYRIQNITISSYINITKANIFEEINFIPTHLELKFIDTVDLSNIIGYRYEEDDYINDTIDHRQINESDTYNLGKFFKKEIKKSIDKYKGARDLIDYLCIREYLYKVANRDKKSLSIIIDLINKNYQMEDLVQILKKELFIVSSDEIFIKIANAVNNFKFENYGNMEISLTDNLESFLLNVHRGFFDINFFKKTDNVKIYLSDLSSGEQKFINIFANLFYIARKKYKDSNKGYLFILDEPDIYLHPAWQKKIISLLVSYFEHTNIFQNNKIQLLITSHSPFILSDIPKNHVIFMKDGAQIDALTQKETFGANIHTLLSHSFFMHDGLMGEFAKRKINEAIENIQSKKDSLSQEQIKSIISVVGEPFLQLKLEQMYNNKFDIDDELEALHKQQQEIHLKIQQLNQEKSENAES